MLQQTTGEGDDGTGHDIIDVRPSSTRNGETGHGASNEAGTPHRAESEARQPPKDDPKTKQDEDRGQDEDDENDDDKVSVWDRLRQHKIDFGYTATLAGLAISPGGLVTMVMFIVVGRLGFIDPKYLIALGGLIMAAAMYDLTNTYGDLDFGFFAWSRVYLGLGLPLVFNSVTSASYNGIAPDKTDQASSLINVARNFGGSIGVSLAHTTLARREQFHQSRLVEHIGSWNPAYGETLQQVQNYFATKPLVGTGAGAYRTALAWIGQVVQTQASLWAYIDVFFTLSLIGVAITVLAITLRPAKPGASVQAAA
jgi:DHA2 family multidrug resistance protein